MTKTLVYKYESKGYIVYSETEPTGFEYEIWYKLVPQKDKLLTKDGENLYFIKIVNDPDNWYEVDNPNYIVQFSEN